jgi:hypothetical protein
LRVCATRRKQIESAVETTERELPALTDWILWTHWPLTKADQKWFGALKTRMRLHQWTSLEVESYLGGDAAFLRNTYFGEWILTPERLASWHEESVAPVRQRWQPEVHQVVDGERGVRRTRSRDDSEVCRILGRAGPASRAICLLVFVFSVQLDEQRHKSRLNMSPCVASSPSA